MLMKNFLRKSIDRKGIFSSNSEKTARLSRSKLYLIVTNCIFNCTFFTQTDQTDDV